MGVRVNRFSQTTRDANEPALVTLAKKLGMGWWQGPPLDGWAIHRGVWMPVEIKLPEREGLSNEYTPAQRRFRTWCETYNGPHLIWRTDDDVIAAAGGFVTAGREKHVR